MRQVHGLSRHSIDFKRVQHRKDVAGNSPHGHRFPGTNDEISKNHHPASREADELRKDFRGIGNLARRVGYGHYQLAIHIADGQQQGSADGEAKNGSQRPAPGEPVIHYDQPPHSNHCAPSQGEVVGDAKRAGELSHGCCSLRSGRSRGDLKRGKASQTAGWPPAVT